MSGGSPAGGRRRKISNPLVGARDTNATMRSRFLTRPGGAKRPGCYRTAGRIYLGDREAMITIPWARKVWLSDEGRAREVGPC